MLCATAYDVLNLAPVDSIAVLYNFYTAVAFRSTLYNQHSQRPSSAGLSLLSAIVPSIPPTTQPIEKVAVNALELGNAGRITCRWQTNSTSTDPERPLTGGPPTRCCRGIRARTNRSQEPKFAASTHIAIENGTGKHSAAEWPDRLLSPIEDRPPHDTPVLKPLDRLDPPNFNLTSGLVAAGSNPGTLRRMKRNLRERAS
ncbi:hypothetical protein BJ912DRAFT_927433 [Pholiota molesta]|nr:hypothetical protein BJ912DRAFT_927433 [Pholiota molesta]